MMAHGSKPVRTIRLKTGSVPVLVGILLVILVLSPDRAWKALFAGFGLTLGLSYFWARSLQEGLHLQRDLRYGWKQVGDRLQERVYLENSGWAPALWVFIDDQSNLEQYGIDTVATIPGKWDRSWYSRGICGRRGIYTLGPTTLSSADPLGIFEIEIQYSQIGNMMVAPDVIPLPTIEVAAGGRIGGNRSSSHGLEPTVTAAGVREYVAGDSLRWIHWPTTARQDELFVHQYDAEPSSDWWVVLDMDRGVHIGEGRSSSEECAAILAASIVNKGLNEGKSVGLISQGEHLIWHPPRAGRTQLYDALRSLALLRPGGLRLAQLLEQVRRSIDQNTSLIIVTPSLSLEWMNAIAVLQKGGIVPTVILLDPNTFGGSGDLDKLRSHLHSMKVRHYTFTAELLKPLDEREEAEARDWWMLYRPSDAMEGEGDHFWTRLWRQLRRISVLGLFYLGLVNAIGQAIRGIDNLLMGMVAFWGLFVGWSFSRRPAHRWLLLPLNFSLGLIIALSEILPLGNYLGAILSRLSSVFSGLYAWGFERGPFPDPSPLAAILTQLWVDISQFGNRIWSWVLSTAREETYYDPLVVVLFWGAILWGAAVWSMWRIQKKGDPFLALFPSVLLVGFTLSATGEFSLGLLLMFGSLVILTVLLDRDGRKEAWEAEGLFRDADIGPRFLRAGFLLALSVTMAAWLLSLVSLEPISRLLERRNLTRSESYELVESLGLERQEETERPDALVNYLNVRLPNARLLGDPPELVDEVVLRFRFEGVSAAGEKDSVNVPLRYVRGLSYDRYTGRGWASRSVEVLDYEPGQKIIAEVSDNYFVVRQEVMPTSNSPGRLFAVGEPLRVDKVISIAWRLNEQDHRDMFGGAVGTQAYRVDSILPNVNEQELRNAGQAYPTWIQNRYITLPASVPERVLSLARDLTAVEPTPYDRAVALERYLRTFPYTLEVPTPPVGEDITEYFLFTLREGYCDYYATSMVVLARAAGLPARLVTGYVLEQPDQEGADISVTADRAHSWVEIYFPEIGWIPFEPTAGRPEISRGEAASALAIPELDLSLEFLVKDEPLKYFGWLKWPAIVAGSLSLLSLLVLLMLEIRFQRKDTQYLVPAIFLRLYSFGKSMGVQPKAGDSSSEYLARLSQKISLLLSRYRWKTVPQEIADLLVQLDQIYQKQLFKHSFAIEGERSLILALYTRLRIHLMLFWIMIKLTRTPVLKHLILESESRLKSIRVR